MGTCGKEYIQTMEIRKREDKMKEVSECVTDMSVNEYNDLIKLAGQTLDSTPHKSEEADRSSSKS